MLQKIKKILAPPAFVDKKMTEAAQYINAITYIGIILLALLILSRSKNLFSTTNTVLGALILMMIVAQILMHKGRVSLSATLLIALTWLAMTYMAWQADGVRNASLIAYLVLIFLANLLGNTRLSITLTIFSIATLWVLVYAETAGVIIPTLDSPTNLARDLTVIFILIASVIYITIKNLNQALSDSNEKEKELLIRNQELIKFQGGLEKLVVERTSELEENTKNLQRRTIQLQTISEVSQTVALVQNLDILLPEITNLISHRFDFYHVGIFLISEDGKYAVLQASNSPGGKQMLAHGHQLEVGEKGIVGRVAQDKTPRVALDVGEDATYFNNPRLPDTHSEMALPLKISDKIIGVLDVQSRRKSAFTQEDADVFNALANQVAIAIENARLAKETQVALEEAQEISRQYIHQAWTELSKVEHKQGYRYINNQLHPLDEIEEIASEKSDIISIPVQLHEEILGFLEIEKSDPTHPLDEDEMSLVQAVANRTALALENARLLEETSRRAGREQLVSTITTKIRSTNDPDVMIQTALDELKRALGASKIELATQMPKVDKPENVEES